jgi:hypothetical protein
MKVRRDGIPEEQPVATNLYELTPASGTITDAGNTIVLTPSAGKRLRIFYLSYNPDGETDIGYRFGAAGPLFLFNHIRFGGSIVGKDFGDQRYLQGAVDEDLVLNQSAIVNTNWNVFYLEV